MVKVNHELGTIVMCVTNDIQPRRRACVFNLGIWVVEIAGQSCYPVAKPVRTAVRLEAAQREDSTRLACGS
jgi:hypothetical protein